jgi:hypothetical protein
VVLQELQVRVELQELAVLTEDQQHFSITKQILHHKTVHQTQVIYNGIM